MPEAEKKLILQYKDAYIRDKYGTKDAEREAMKDFIKDLMKERQDIDNQINQLIGK